MEPTETQSLGWSGSNINRDCSHPQFLLLAYRPRSLHECVQKIYTLNLPPLTQHWMNVLLRPYSLRLRPQNRAPPSYVERAVSHHGGGAES